MAVTCAVMLGFALDALLGDPKWLPHPVCAVGKLISCMEKLLRRLFPPRKGAMIFAGVVLWLRRQLRGSVPRPSISRQNQFLAWICREFNPLLADFCTKKLV